MDAKASLSPDLGQPEDEGAIMQRIHAVEEVDRMAVAEDRHAGAVALATAAEPLDRGRIERLAR